MNSPISIHLTKHICLSHTEKCMVSMKTNLFAFLVERLHSVEKC